MRLRALVAYDILSKYYQSYVCYRFWNKFIGKFNIAWNIYWRCCFFSWDRWVLEDQILKNNDASRALQSRLYQKAIQ